MKSARMTMSGRDDDFRGRKHFITLGRTDCCLSNKSFQAKKSHPVKDVFVLAFLGKSSVKLNFLFRFRSSFIAMARKSCVGRLERRMKNRACLKAIKIQFRSRLLIRALAPLSIAIEQARDGKS